MYLTTTRFLALLLTFAALLFVGCDDDDPEIENEEELITTVTLTMQPTAGGAPVVFTFLDPDGDGPTAPVTTDTSGLAANTEYQGSITFSNASDPADVEDITLEIEAEDDEHQIFYTPAAGLNLDFTYDDVDDDGNPVGLMTLAQTGNASTGELTITLRHEPTKDAAGISIDNPTPAGGSTDIEVVFQVTVR